MGVIVLQEHVLL